MENTIPVDRTDLEKILQLALGGKVQQKDEWKTAPLQGGLEFGSAIYRLQGVAEAVQGPQAWSLVLKAIQPDPQYSDPQGYRYWKREAEAYRSGLLQELPGPVTAPFCYDVCQRPDGSVWMWLEDIRDDLGSPWTVEHYGLVARWLGQFNGAYLAGQPLPGDAWVTHDWLRKYLEHAAPMLDFIRENPAHPVVQKMFPGFTLALTLAMWEEHTRMLKVLDGLPQTFCHQDAFGRNLFIRGAQVVAIDWGYAGIAPVGAELAPLIGVAFGLAGVPSSQAHNLDRVCFEGYLQGLSEAGWTPDPRQVRMGYAFTVFLRYVLGATIGEMLPGILDEKTRLHWAEGIGTSSDKVGESDAGIVNYYQSIAMEALKLMGLGCMGRVLGRAVRYSISLGRKRRQAGQKKPGIST